MTKKTVVVLSCGHVDPSVPNDRYSWLGDFLYDLKPDCVVDLGDGAEMRSLNSFDTNYPKAVASQSYEKDIDHYNDAMERMRFKFRHNKRRQPYYIGFEGNHENRIKKAVAREPRLEGSKYGISFGHLQTDHWFDEYHEYQNSAPALVEYDGVTYGHFVASGNYGSAMSTKHHGHSLVEKLACSVTVGHTHKFDYHYKGEAHRRPMHGLVVGCFKGADEEWAGQANREWRKGVVVKRELEAGDYELEWVSLKRLEKMYG
jgi:hypothetical protein